ncbi:MAG: hypothetical protein Ct9H90mP3_1510 [Flammeovirgaceae bacterium]|nr:MAG: hypothetical protein Ct9H90mP3_1510 [Flammeovirgaceae bacterium]
MEVNKKGPDEYPPKPITKSGLNFIKIYIDFITENNILNGRVIFFKKKGNFPKKKIFRISEDLFIPDIHNPYIGKSYLGIIFISILSLDPTNKILFFEFTF